MGVMYKNGPVLSVGGGGAGRGGGRGGELPPGLGGGNLQPMAVPPRLATLDGPAPGACGGGRRPRGRRVRRRRARRRGRRRGDQPGRASCCRSRPIPTTFCCRARWSAAKPSRAGRRSSMRTLGKGHVVLFGVRPFWRFQTQGSFFLAFNAMLNWNDLNAGRK